MHINCVSKYTIWSYIYIFLYLRRYWKNIIIRDSNMTWFFSPIKSTDTNSALLAR